jgi:hypothetical protein
MTNEKAVAKLEKELSHAFSELVAIQHEIQKKLSVHANGKTLKGNELVGWLGEVITHPHF